MLDGDRASRHCPPDVAIQMGEIASRCLQGAGIGVIQYPSRVRLKRLINSRRNANMPIAEITREVARIVSTPATESYVRAMISDIWLRSAFRSIRSTGEPPFRRQRLLYETCLRNRKVPYNTGEARIDECLN